MTLSQQMTTLPSLRRLTPLRAAFLALLLLAGFRLAWLRLALFQGRAAHTVPQIGADTVAYSRLPNSPQFRQFIDQVRQKTNPGSTIQIVIPSAAWRRGYEYAFFRASYLLAGRRVLPCIDFSDRPIGTSATTDFIAAWPGSPEIPRYLPVWSGDGGTLLRRAR